MYRSLILAVVLAACSSNTDPFAAGGIDAPGGGGGNGDGGNGDGGNVDAPVAAHACVDAPKRIVILGDSITACSVIGGPDGTDCVSKQFANYVIAHYGPGATYENHAVGGAVLADIAGQLANVSATPGPTLVMMFIGGNDLAPYIFMGDAQAMTAWTGTIEPALQSTYDATFATLADSAKFPGGATLLMNTQYNPFDDCAAGPYNVSLVKQMILGQFNAKIAAISSAHATASIIVDQFTKFLGHGHCYQQTSCPHYDASAAPYMKDLIHANAAGNAVLSGIDNAGADRLYRDCTH